MDIKGIIKDLVKNDYGYAVLLSTETEKRYTSKFDTAFWDGKKIGDEVTYFLKEYNGKYYVNIPKAKGSFPKKATSPNTSSNPQTALLAAANYCAHRPAANAEHTLILAEKYLNWLDDKKGTSLPTSEKVPLPTQYDVPPLKQPTEDGNEDLPF